MPGTESYLPRNRSMWPSFSVKCLPRKMTFSSSVSMSPVCDMTFIQVSHGLKSYLASVKVLGRRHKALDSTIFTRSLLSMNLKMTVSLPCLSRWLNLLLRSLPYLINTVNLLRVSNTRDQGHLSQDWTLLRWPRNLKFHRRLKVFLYKIRRIQIWRQQDTYMPRSTSRRLSPYPWSLHCVQMGYWARELLKVELMLLCLNYSS